MKGLAITVLVRIHHRPLLEVGGKTFGGGRVVCTRHGQYFPFSVFRKTGERKWLSANVARIE